MFVGKEIRLKRLLGPSGRLLAITIDHPITRGVMDGLVPIREAMKKIVAGGPDAVTMHKGIAENVFRPYAGRTALIFKSTAYSIPYHPAYDAPVADVEEAVRAGADAISVGMIVGGPEQAAQLTHLGRVSKEAASMGMPLVAHIYPKGTMIKDSKDARNLAYAVRAGAELGVDIVKTNWSGSPETFRRVIEACPARVALAGGEVGDRLEDYFKMTRDAIDIGLAGVTYGRFVWGNPNPTAVIKALRAVIHEGADVEKAMRVHAAALKEEK
ncbi:MAG: fructose-bisphosphate aldolase [Planctomycetota bacterium]|jgi:DhnA family fructose-bisphosphate aldolase class Ia|nr:fructose-bisphosphate aldolase [Planctomycetota bacterium]